MKSPRQHHGPGRVLRTIFGVALFGAWGAETIVWVSSTVRLAIHGHGEAVVTAVAALSLMGLLAGMEGLEVAVIDRWSALYPNRTASDLARWLSARQLFVALIVTSATLLARRSVLVIPVAGTRVSGGVVASLFDLTWTGFAVLWFAQIVPKVLAATNPDGYLRRLQRPLFPVVEFVRSIGVSQPGEWVASGIARITHWAPTDEITASRAPRRGSLAGGWRGIISEGESGGEARNPESGVETPEPQG